MYDRNQPDKAIDILDEVCAKVSLKESHHIKRYNHLNKELQDIIKRKNEAIINNDFDKASEYKSKENELMNEINNLELGLYKDNVKEVTLEDVAEVVSIKTKIPIYELLDNQEMIIKNMEKNISSKIVGQEKAVNEVVNIAKRIKLGFKDDSRCYSIMFCGPTGVGKTELAKIFGNNLVGETNVIKLDMSEYIEGHSVSKIIGAPPGYVGYADNKNLLEEIRNKPYSVIILDEIEKAHSSVINLFFQILDEGKIKDASGKIIRFDNIVIVMTSNIGFEENSLGFNKPSDNDIITKLKDYFQLPFINRIDNIVIFNRLTEDNIEELVSNRLRKLKDKYHKKGIKLKISNGVINEIIKETNYEEFGARKIDKVIKQKLESIIIEKVMDNIKNINIKTVYSKTPV